MPHPSSSRQDHLASLATPTGRAFRTLASDDPANGGERRYDPRQRRLAHEADRSLGRSWRRADKRWSREPWRGPGCKTQGDAKRQGRSQAKRPNVVGLPWSSGSLSASHISAAGVRIDRLVSVRLAIRQSFRFELGRPTARLSQRRYSADCIIRRKSLT